MTVGYWVGQVRGYGAPFHLRHRECDPRGRARGNGEASGARRMSGSSPHHPADARLSRAGDDAAAAIRSCRAEPACRSRRLQRRTTIRRRPTSGRCREGHRRDQAAAARASDRASAALAVVRGDAGRRLLHLPLFRQARSSRCWSSRCSRAGQGKLIYTDIFEAFFVEVKVALVRGADDQLPGARDADVAVRRARACTPRKRRPSCRSC